ncbi:MAG: hypothetical protein J6A62_00005, partial [Oscillospiraceae bacterium]|nr:hypothetical protein [Oscillospiraceae bacterium]
MNVNKQAQCGGSAVMDELELEQINRFSRKKLSAEEVYTFAVRLCDNEVDRDGERFENGTLDDLARLFVGKTGIFDHQWSATGQTARIYRTQVVEEPNVLTAAGDGYRYIKGYAYMLRTPGNQELIAQLDGGILREVSVGCAVEQSVCSICGKQAGSCAHKKGERYEGKLCYTKLEGAADAFEWSFVAVPAQPKAGVLRSKSKGQEPGLKQLARKHGCQAELEQLEHEALLGRRYMAALRREVVRLCGLSQQGVDHRVMEGIAEKLEEPELLELKRLYSKQAAQRYPVMTQLEHHRDDAHGTGADG